MPIIEQEFFEIFTLIPNFLIASIAAKTSSESKRFLAIDKPLAIDAKRTHLMLRLLSPLTLIDLLKFCILWFITITF